MSKHIQFDKVRGSATGLRYLSQQVFGKKPFVVLVYHPQCGHCVHLKDTKEDKGPGSAWSNFVKSSGDTVIVEVHAGMYEKLASFIVKTTTKLRNTAQQQALNAFREIIASVTGYPTIMFVDSQMTVTPYESSRSSKAMTASLKEWKKKALHHTP